MSIAANVKSIQALADLKTALLRYGSDVQETLQRVKRTIDETRQSLAERQNYWRGQVRRCEETLKQARAALTRCQNSAYTDRDGRRHVPDCRGLEEQVAQAKRRLDEALHELHTVEQAIKAVEAAAQSYEQQARRLAGFVNNDLKQGKAMLERKIAVLQGYTWGEEISSAVGLTASFSVSSPIDRVSTLQKAAIGILAVGAELQESAMIGIGTTLLQLATRYIPHQLGDHGEILSQRLLSEQFGWQELPFDQPKHGFDRVMSAPGLPAIIVESKVNQTGKFHPGQTNAGEQGTLKWNEDKLERMSNPDSAQYSENNARLARLMRDMGTENIPVVAVVIETESGNASIHYRLPADDQWSVLQTGEDLSEILQNRSGLGEGEYGI